MIILNGRKAKLRREFLGLTQEEVANMLGISRQAYSAIENGRSLPKRKVKVETIARCLRCDVDEITYEGNEKIKTKDTLYKMILELQNQINILEERIEVLEKS